MAIKMRKVIPLLVIMCAFIGEAAAHQHKHKRCCSHHGGAMGCDARTGRYVCADRTLSRCYCETVYYIDEEFYDGDGAYYLHSSHHHDHYYHHHHH